MGGLALRELVTVQRASSIDDGFGNVIGDWENLTTLWAAISETVGGEAISAGRIEAKKTAAVVVRASAASRSITTADRIIARGQAWNIRSVLPIDDGRYAIKFLCEEGVAT